MPWKLSRTAAFSRDLHNLSQKDQARITKAVNAMPGNMSRAHLVKLSGPHWRLRVGCWRVFVKLDAATGTIYLLAIERRSSKTY